jgi:FkbM family methyltransferase
MLRNVRGKLRWMAAAPWRPKKPEVRQIRYRGAQFAVLANEDVGWRLVVHGHYEPREWSSLEGLIHATDLCVDIGANVGIYSVLMAQKAPRGRVVAFEPLPLYCTLLDLNSRLNGLTNIEIRSSAVGDKGTHEEFSVAEDGAYSSLRPTGRKPESECIQVPSVTLDEVFARTGEKVDIIKVDVEGAELLVLMGGRALLSDAKLRPRALLVELEPSNEEVYSYTPADVISLMKQLNYNVYSLVREGVVRGYSAHRCVESVLFLAE